MQPTPRQSDRAFGITFGVVFALISGVAWLFFDTTIKWTIGLSVSFFMIAFIYPGLLLPLNRLWGQIVKYLGLFNNHLLLGIFFYLLIFPTGVIIRLFGGDPMTRKIDLQVASYWTDVNRTAKADNLEDMF